MHKPVLYVNLMGRIGNNLFQLATAASLAKKYDCRMIAIPNPYYEKFPDYCLSNYLQPFKSTLLRNILIHKDVPSIYSLYKEPSWHYQEIPYQPNLFLWGFFQSEKYFDTPLVRELFQIDSLTSNILYQKYGSLLSRGAVSINVRRGDFLSCQDYHPVCTLDYFNEAIDLIGRQREFLITSDDLPWCKTHFKGANFHFADRTDPVENLYLQSLCTDHILSNSTFSWWGAWLNPDTFKTVVAPRKWFGPKDSDKDTTDLLPKNWIQI